MTEPAVAHKVSVIQAVTSPLGFLVLAFLAVEGLLGILVVRRATSPDPLLWAMVGALLALVVVVVGLAIWLPEALAGVRRLSAHYPVLFCEKLSLGLDGSLANLSGVEQDEAWITLAAVIEDIEDSHIDRPYIEFCKGVGERLRDVANAKARWRRGRGTIA